MCNGTIIAYDGRIAMRSFHFFQRSSTLVPSIRRFHPFKTLLFIYAMLLGLVIPGLSAKSGTFDHAICKQQHLSISQQNDHDPLRIGQICETNFFEEEESDEESDHGPGVWESTALYQFKTPLAETQISKPCKSFEASFAESVPLVILHHSWKFYLS